MRESRAAWFWRGASGIVSIPALILMTSFVGFGVLCRESGLTMGQAVFITASMWALPNQVLLVGAITSGASIFVAALAATLAAVRLMPMVAAWVPVIRGPKTPVWQLPFLSHFVAVTAWVFAMLRLPKMPAHRRVPYFAGFACTLTAANLAITALSYAVAGALPPVLAAAWCRACRSRWNSGRRSSPAPRPAAAQAGAGFCSFDNRPAWRITRAREAACSQRPSTGWSPAASPMRRCRWSSRPASANTTCAGFWAARST